MMTEKAAEYRETLAKALAEQGYPDYANALYGFTNIVLLEPSCSTVGQVGLSTLYINSRLSIEEACVVVRHEFLHVKNRHYERAGSERKKNLFNIAADLEISNYYSAEDVALIDNSENLKNCYHVYQEGCTKYKRMVAEDIYDDLVKNGLPLTNNQPQMVAQGGDNSGDGDGDGNGNGENSDNQSTNGSSVSILVTVSESDAEQNGAGSCSGSGDPGQDDETTEGDGKTGKVESLEELEKRAKEMLGDMADTQNRVSKGLRKKLLNASASEPPKEEPKQPKVRKGNRKERDSSSKERQNPLSKNQEVPNPEPSVEEPPPEKKEEQPTEQSTGGGSPDTEQSEPEKSDDPNDIGDDGFPYDPLNDPSPWEGFDAPDDGFEEDESCQGIGTGHAERNVEKPKAAKIRLLKSLRNVFGRQKFYRAAKTYAKYNKRDLSMPDGKDTPMYNDNRPDGFIRKGKKRKYKDVMTLGVYCDVSGSMSKEKISLALGTCEEIGKIKRCVVTTHYFDTEVQDNFFSGGGTDYNVVLAHAKEKGYRSIAIITDNSSDRIPSGVYEFDNLWIIGVEHSGNDDKEKYSIGPQIVDGTVKVKFFDGFIVSTADD